MHTTTFGASGREGNERSPDNPAVYMHHNGDYSGDVIIIVAASHAHSGHPEIKVPFAALEHLVACKIHDDTIIQIENMDPVEHMWSKLGVARQ